MKVLRKRKNLKFLLPLSHVTKKKKKPSKGLNTS